MRLSILGGETLPLKVNAGDSVIPLRLSSIQIVEVGRPPVYEGSYEITPASYIEQVLPTQDKLMEEDLRVQRIPNFLVSNPAGGNTFIVGEEYYA